MPQATWHALRGHVTGHRSASAAAGRSTSAADHHQAPDINRTDGSGHGVAIVTCRYRARQADAIVVFTAGSVAESELLTHVDVEILDPHCRQDLSLEGAVPATYVTHWSGAAGRSEAILGWPG
jgi:hypothetical protein